MPSLEIESNQIFLLNPETKKTSIVIKEEEINPVSTLFILADLVDIKKRPEVEDLNKIINMVVETFTENQKAIGEATMEHILAEINQKLADLAHGGKKSWVGKLSCLIVLKTNDKIFISASGQVSAFLKRSGQFIQIINQEKQGEHPLKMFSDFTIGKLLENDLLVLLTANVLNYISLELFGKKINLPSPEQAAQELTVILKDAVSINEGFGLVLISLLNKKKPKIVHYENSLTPLPETEEVLPISSPTFKQRFKFKLPQIKISNIEAYQKLTPHGKFFFVSFLTFLVLFLLNVLAFAITGSQAKTGDKVKQQVSALNGSIDDTESALIYKDENKAKETLLTVVSNHEQLKKLSKETASQFDSTILDLNRRVNKITVIENPQILVELKSNPRLFTKAGNNFVFVYTNSDVVTTHSSGGTKDAIFLNKLDGEITGLIHVNGIGNFITTDKKIYKLNDTQKIYEEQRTLNTAELSQLKFLAPDRVYSLDLANKQILRFTVSAKSVSVPQNLLKNSLADNPIDLGLDNNAYVLFAEGLKKFTSGAEQQFKLETLADPITSLNGLAVGNNLYLLAAGKKRIIIFDKNGKLINQIYLPNQENLSNIWIDEGQRQIYILSNNKLLQVTF